MKYQALAKVYREMGEVPQHIEERWAPIHMQTRAIVEAQREGRPHSRIKQPIPWLRKMLCAYLECH